MKKAAFRPDLARKTFRIIQYFIWQSRTKCHRHVAMQGPSEFVTTVASFCILFCRGTFKIMIHTFERWLQGGIKNKQFTIKLFLQTASTRKNRPLYSSVSVQAVSKNENDCNKIKAKKRSGQISNVNFASEINHLSSNLI